MIRGLLTKELRQHGFALMFLFLVVLGGLALIAGHGPLHRALGGGFSAVQLLHTTYVPLAALVLGQMLIATEFRQKTQLFLEGLPLPRWRMLAVKFTLGLAVLAGAIGAAIFAAWWQARGTDAITPRFAALVALKSAGWVWFIYTLCFAHAFLGRYRVAFGLALLFGYFTLDTSGVRVSEFGPFALIDDRFAYERFVLPGRALAIAAALGLGLAALGFAMGLVRDASVASLLAEKMSPREKVFITFLTLTVLMLCGYIAEHRQTATPVQMPGATEAQRGVVRVFASAAVDAPTREETAALERVAQRAADELGALAEYLGCATFPPVFIVHRRDLAGGAVQSGGLKPAQGGMVRANLTAKEFYERDLLEAIVQQTLLAHTGGLAGRERNAWVHDALSAWWPYRQPRAAAESDLNPKWVAKARPTLPPDFSARHLDAWLSVAREDNLRGSGTLAATGLVVLAQRHGAEARQRFLAAMFREHRPADFRGWLADVFRPRARLFRAATGVDEKQFAREWRDALALSTTP